jgi:hypothetical protein
MVAYEVGEHVVEAFLDIAVAVPDLLEVIQPVDVVFLLDERGDFEDGALEQFLVVAVDHQHAVLLLLLRHAQPVDDAACRGNYL